MTQASGRTRGDRVRLIGASITGVIYVAFSLYFMWEWTGGNVDETGHIMGDGRMIGAMLIVSTVMMFLAAAAFVFVGMSRSATAEDVPVEKDLTPKEMPLSQPVLSLTPSPTIRSKEHSVLYGIVVGFIFALLAVLLLSRRGER